MEVKMKVSRGKENIVRKSFLLGFAFLTPINGPSAQTMYFQIYYNYR